MLRDWFFHLLNPVNTVCDEWCLYFSKIVGIWFTGIATFAAVLVSLALARREGARMTVSAGDRDVLGSGSRPPFPEVLSITVRDIGSRPVPRVYVGQTITYARIFDSHLKFPVGRAHSSLRDRVQLLAHCV